jgi:phospholipase C
MTFLHPEALMRLVAAALTLGLHTVGAAVTHNHARTAEAPGGIHKIKHVVVIMQENRSFDTYFGTYPGADGIPTVNGHPAVCVPDPAHGGCIAPFLNEKDTDQGGPHGENAALTDIDGGRMDGFIASAESEHERRCVLANEPNCVTQEGASHEVMGYHNGSQIPNYWAYAKNFVLQDHMFESDIGWSLPEHLYEVSGWSAKCLIPSEAMSCVSAPQSPESVPEFSKTGTEPQYPWTDLTYLLFKHSVSWGYYVYSGGEPDCADNEESNCPSVPAQNAATPQIWNPLPYFTDVHEDNQLSNIQSISNFYADAEAGTLPAVSWVVPNDKVSEHPPAKISEGQAYVTNLVNTIMRSPDWSSTAIFISWDDWGGFYDHVLPPTADQNGYGLRVPGLVISPYARYGYVDHQVLSHDAYLKFIEDDFLGGERLNPATDGRPDSRPNVRENNPLLGNLIKDFNFNQPPAPPFLLPTRPAPWSIPIGFRLFDSGTPLRQTPRYHKGNVIASLTCNMRCRARVSGYVTLRHAGIARVNLSQRGLVFSGTRNFKLALSGAPRKTLLSALSAKHTPAQAVVRVTAAGVAEPKQVVSATMHIRLLP